MKTKAIQRAHYIEALATAIREARPYYVDSEARLGGARSRTNDFPTKPGIYLILRRVNLDSKDYTTRGVNTQQPLVLYVGKTTSRRAIRERLADRSRIGSRFPRSVSL